MPERKTAVYAISNSIDVDAYNDLPALEDGANLPHHDLIFMGKMDYRPNVDAVLWFAAEVWPAIRQALPGATWAIVGQKPHARLEGLGQMDGVTVTGWVERVQPYLAGGTLFLMPFRVGSGTRLKLIEAMAAGKAIVSTPIGAEGFPVQHKREIYLGETAAELKAAVLHLLQNPEERARLGQAARAFARRYDWRVGVPQFEQVYAQIL
jgi:glycosyltransferase involved in cell wall biosynthesis